MNATLFAQGKRVRVLPKVRYYKPIVSIDAIRSDAHEYLQYEEYITRGMMTLENDIFESKEDEIVLIDRPVTDSLFYMTFYLDPTKLTHDELVQYHNLVGDALKHMAFAYEYIYDHVLFFAPISNDSHYDLFRPAQASILKHTESALVNMYNKAYAKEGRYHQFDLNKSENIPTAINTITNLIELNEILKNQTSK